MSHQKSMIRTCLLSVVVFTLPAGAPRAADWPALGREHTRIVVSPESGPSEDSGVAPRLAGGWYTDHTWHGRVHRPHQLAKKYPQADREWVWQWVFPAQNKYFDREARLTYRHHFHESAVQKSVRQAARKAGLSKRATPHTFRHSFATHVLETRQDIRTVQELPGHIDVRTTMIDTHVLNRRGQGVLSPPDRLPERQKGVPAHVNRKSPWINRVRINT